MIWSFFFVCLFVRKEIKAICRRRRSSWHDHEEHCRDESRECRARACVRGGGRDSADEGHDVDEELLALAAVVSLAAHVPLPPRAVEAHRVVAAVERVGSCRRTAWTERFVVHRDHVVKPDGITENCKSSDTVKFLLKKRLSESNRDQILIKIRLNFSRTSSSTELFRS